MFPWFSDLSGYDRTGSTGHSHLVRRSCTGIASALVVASGVPNVLSISCRAMIRLPPLVLCVIPRVRRAPCAKADLSTEYSAKSFISSRAFSIVSDASAASLLGTRNPRPIQSLANLACAMVWISLLRTRPWGPASTSRHFSLPAGIKAKLITPKSACSGPNTSMCRAALLFSGDRGKPVQAGLISRLRMVRDQKRQQQRHRSHACSQQEN